MVQILGANIKLEDKIGNNYNHEHEQKTNTRSHSRDHSKRKLNLLPHEGQALPAEPQRLILELEFKTHPLQQQQHSETEIGMDWTGIGLYHSHTLFQDTTKKSTKSKDGGRIRN